MSTMRNKNNKVVKYLFSATDDKWDFPTDNRKFCTMALISKYGYSLSVLLGICNPRTQALLIQNIPKQVQATVQCDPCKLQNTIWDQIVKRLMWCDAL